MVSAVLHAVDIMGSSGRNRLNHFTLLLTSLSLIKRGKFEFMSGESSFCGFVLLHRSGLC